MNFSLLKGKVNYTFLNPYSYLILRKKYPALLSTGDFFFFFDGILLIWILKVLNFKRVSRYSFDDTSLAPLVFEYCLKNNLKIALIGSAPGIVDKAKKLIENRYIGLDISYTCDGYFNEEKSNSILLDAKKCDVIVCSMGTPKQELLLRNLRDSGWNGVGFTCGGYLDQLVSAKGSRYYPSWIDKLNLRWLYRIYKEPKRLFFRYVFQYPLGILFFIYDYYSGKLNKSKIMENN